MQCGSACSPFWCMLWRRGWVMAGEIDQAAFDATVEALPRLYPGRQVFVFGPLGEPMWSCRDISDAELRVFRQALPVLDEAIEAPWSGRHPSGQFTALILDADRTLFAVVIHDARVAPPVARA